MGLVQINIMSCVQVLFVNFLMDWTHVGNAMNVYFCHVLTVSVQCAWLSAHSFVCWRACYYVS